MERDGLTRTVGGAVLLYLLEFILIAALFTEHWALAVQHREEGWMRDWLGPAETREIIARTERWYGAAFIESGAMRTTYEWMIPSKEERAKSGAFAGVGESTLYPFLKRRLDSVWRSIYQATERISEVVAWAPLLAVVIVGFVAEGVFARGVKQASFAYASPLCHRLGVLLLAILAVLCLSGLVLPLPVHPLLVPAAGLVSALFARTLIANTQKKV